MDSARRDAKRSRLENFRRRLPFVSASALSTICDQIKRDGLPEGGQKRDNWRDARDAQISKPTPFGPVRQERVLRNKDGTEDRLRVAHPLSMLWLALIAGGAFAALFMSVVEVRPPTADAPWNLIMYSDEVTPGNQLAPANSRKVQVVYFSFKEFGMEMLVREECWFCVCVKRSALVRNIDGGMAQLMGVVLKLFFGVGTFNLAIAGVGFTLACGRRIRLYAKLGMFVQDGGAHKLTWLCKGDAGTRYCMCCLNIVHNASELEDSDDDENLLVCNALHDSELVPATDQDIRDSVHRLAAAVGSRDFKRREQAEGFTHNPWSLMLDAELTDVVFPVRQFMHDWMHALFVHGVFNATAFLLFEAFLNLGVDAYALFRGFVAKWNWPARVHANGETLAGIFTPERKTSHRKAKSWKMQASDALNLIPTLAYFVSIVLLPLGIGDNECNAFLALSDLVEFLTVLPRGGMDPELLRSAVHRFLELYVLAFSFENTFQKFHWLLHLTSEYVQHGCLVSCFVHERKHKALKKYANHILNAPFFETSLMNDVSCEHLHVLCTPSSVFKCQPGLVKPRVASRKTAAAIREELDINDVHIDVYTSHESRFSRFGTCAVGDVVFINSNDGIGYDAGQIWANIACNDVPVSIISIWEFISYDVNASARDYRKVRNPQMVSTDNILETCIWTGPSDGGIITVLVPPCLR